MANSSNIGGDFGSIGEGSTPKVTEEDMVRAVHSIFGSAQDAADAELIVNLLGIPRETLVRARTVLATKTNN